MGSQDHHVLPPPKVIQDARVKLLRKLPKEGLGHNQTSSHLLKDIAPALNRASQSPNYYGFVTGGATPAAAFADNMVTEYDQNVAVHLPNDSIATDVEDAALQMFCELVDLPVDQWNHRIFTVGATGSNIVGLACGREFVIQEYAKRCGMQPVSIAEDGIVEAMRKIKLDKVQIISTVPHSSLRKAASIVGLGRSCFKDVGLFQAPHHFDFAALEKALNAPDTASIISISCAEINTGFFATSGDDLLRIRHLADAYGAWIHVDAAFSLPARVLPNDDPSFRAIVDGVRGIELADSITGDAHKLLNVPYDCGIFLSRHLSLATQVFQNPGAAYLQSGAADIPSPLNIGLENSRRFRALPVYATLAAYGREGHRQVMEKQILLAREIAGFVDGQAGYELLPRQPPSFEKPKEQGLSRIFMVVLFRATDDAVNERLVQRINGTRRIYVSGTVWEGRPAARFAVSNWQVDVDRDLALIKDVLLSVLD